MSAIANSNPSIPSVGSLSAAPAQSPNPPAPVQRDTDPTAIGKAELPKGVGEKTDLHA